MLLHTYIAFYSSLLHLLSSYTFHIFVPLFRIHFPNLLWLTFIFRFTLRRQPLSLAHHTHLTSPSSESLVRRCNKEANQNQISLRKKLLMTKGGKPPNDWWRRSDDGQSVMEEREKLKSKKEMQREKDIKKRKINKGRLRWWVRGAGEGENDARGEKGEKKMVVWRRELGVREGKCAKKGKLRNSDNGRKIMMKGRGKQKWRKEEEEE